MVPRTIAGPGPALRSQDKHCWARAPVCLPAHPPLAGTSSLSHRLVSWPPWSRKVILTQEVQPCGPQGHIAQPCPVATPLYRRTLGQLFCPELTNKAGVAVRAGLGLGSSFCPRKLYDFGQVPFPLSASFSPCVKRVSNAISSLLPPNPGVW